MVSIQLDDFIVTLDTYLSSFHHYESHKINGVAKIRVYSESMSIFFLFAGIPDHVVVDGHARHLGVPQTSLPVISSALTNCFECVLKLFHYSCKEPFK